MSVKRYEIIESSSVFEDADGVLVDYSDYAALEAKCTALAAENAALKSAHPQPFGREMMKALDAYEKHQDETPETGMLDAFFVLRDSIRVDTTATDAFLAEVRAQESKRVYESILDNPAVTDMGSLVDWLEQNANDSVAFAAQLRKGGA